MSDRELLELAAKAHGAIKDYGQDGFFDSPRKEWWNPLTDDGDALRLAVRLGIRMEPAGSTRDFATAMTPGANYKEFRELIRSGADPAMRRCIVRAAAAIAQKD